nr:cytochrome C oxidase subunit IV family protein [bacterium]
MAKLKKQPVTSTIPAVAHAASGHGSVDSHEQHHGVGHIVPFSILIGTFGGLIFLTVVTVAASYVDFGRLNLWVALFIAGIKASLVVYFFMHLK